MITTTELLTYLKIAKTAWLTSTAYKVGDYVIQTAILYECLIDHTSGTFATDLTNLKWSVAGASFIDTCVNVAIDYANGFCNRDFRQANYTEYLDGYGSTINIRNMPLTITDGKITVLQYLDTSTGVWTGIIDIAGDTIDNSTQRNTSGQIRLLKGYTFPVGNENIQVTYEGGYATTPADIKAVCLRRAAVYWQDSPASSHGRLGIASKNTGGQSSSGISFNKDVEALADKEILRRYRIQNV